MDHRQWLYHLQSCLVWKITSKCEKTRWVIKLLLSSYESLWRKIIYYKIQKASLPYLGVSSPRNVTVCGSPHALSDMVRGSAFKDCTFVPLPIYAPYHASHLYDLDAIGFLLDSLRTSEIWNLTQSIPIISHENVIAEKTESQCILDPSLGHKGTMGEALSSALEAILLHRIDIGELATSLKQRIIINGMRSIRLIPIASAAGSLVQHALGSAEMGMQTTIAQPSLLRKSAYANSERHRCKIAIVGSSGRFPGGADTEAAFWDLLLEGKDVHKIVPASRWSQLHM